MEIQRETSIELASSILNRCISLIFLVIPSSKLNLGALGLHFISHVSLLNSSIIFNNLFALQYNSFSRSSTDPKRTAAQQTTPSTDSLLTTFYSRSRLHHLSAWTNDLRALVQRLRQVNSSEAACREGATWRQSILETNDPSYFVNLEARPACSSPKQGKPPSLPARTFFHIDLDCFFVSVAVREKPELKDKAIAIAHTTGTGTYENASERGFHSMSEIASCSYAARKAGVRNGMLLGQARQICPDLLTLPYDFEAYKEVSEQLYRTIAE
ncbi:unnamed protein product [Dicrocoelium dendriticum]|nr:unnamed protein product [Dicrocoelium dendriticum]